MLFNLFENSGFLILKISIIIDINFVVFKIFSIHFYIQIIFQVIFFEILLLDDLANAPNLLFSIHIFCVIFHFNLIYFWDQEEFLNQIVLLIFFIYILLFL